MITNNFDIFNDVLGLKNLIDGFWDSRTAAYNRNSSPLVNLYEKDDVITVKIQAPGVRNEDIQLEIVDNILQLSIKRTADTEGKSFIRKERSFGTFSKSIRIPFKVNTDSIQALLKNGILTVKLNKSEDAKPRKIDIK